MWVEGCFCNWATSGVPQGSISGTLLFGKIKTNLGEWLKCVDGYIK